MGKHLPAALYLAVLGPLFFVVYGGCNALAAQRADVPSCYFEWEHHIPFVPVMILPYLSIDLLFAGSFFLCRDRTQLRTHAARILLAYALSATGFLLFPLRYGWPRPAVEGWLGALFAPLNACDQPYNLCPSLHISLRTILWQVYGPSLQGKPRLRAFAWSWFLLIGVSTLLVYQHHVIDLLGGFAVALACCGLFPDRPLLTHLPCPPFASTRRLPPAWQPSSK